MYSAIFIATLALAANASPMSRSLAARETHGPHITEWRLDASYLTEPIQNDRFDDRRPEFDDWVAESVIWLTEFDGTAPYGVRLQGLDDTVVVVKTADGYEDVIKFEITDGKEDSNLGMFNDIRLAFDSSISESSERRDVWDDGEFEELPVNGGQYIVPVARDQDYSNCFPQYTFTVTAQTSTGTETYTGVDRVNVPVQQHEPTNVTVTYEEDPDFKAVITFNGNPMFMYKKGPSSKIVSVEYEQTIFVNTCPDDD